jgi:hypothetical protein
MEENEMNIDTLSFKNEIASTAFDESSFYNQSRSSVGYSGLNLRDFDDTFMKCEDSFALS